MKKILSLICVGVMVAVGGVVMAGCGEIEIDFVIGYENWRTGYPSEHSGLGMAYWEGHNLQKIVSSLEEWDEARGFRDYLDEVNDKYNADFFEDKSLIIYAFGMGSGGSRVEVKNVSRTNNKLQVSAVGQMGVTTDSVQAMIIIEVDKADIQGVTGLRVRLTGNI